MSGASWILLVIIASAVALLIINLLDRALRDLVSDACLDALRRYDAERKERP